jgi:hypothetical protein
MQLRNVSPSAPPMQMCFLCLPTLRVYFGALLHGLLDPSCVFSVASASVSGALPRTSYLFGGVCSLPKQCIFVEI